MGLVLAEGVVVGGRFRLESPIGEGGMGSIWRAVDETTARPVALKVVRAMRDGELHQRFVREARILRQFSHRNVVGVIDAGELPGEAMLFMAMELLHGSPLSNHLGRPMPAEEILPVLVEVCSGLAAAHAAGVIHRDMKPENIFLAIVEGAGVVPKILDFGLSKAGDGRMQNRISATGQVIGTPAYMSPEQALAAPRLTPATDVWALGVILYEAVSGKLPFSGVNAGKLLDAIVSQAPAPVPAEVDARTRAIIARCLQREPSQRYADAASLCVDLEIALAALRGAQDAAPSSEADRDSTFLPRGALADPVHIAAEPPITRDGRTQRQAIARGRSGFLLAPFAIGLCALAIWVSPGRRVKPISLDKGLARAAKSRAAAVIAASAPKPGR